MDNKEMDKDLDLDLDLIEDEDFKKSVQTLDAQKKHWREKAKKEADEKAKLLEKLQKLEATTIENKQKVEELPKEDLLKLHEKLAKIELRTKGFEDDEIDFIVRTGGNPDDPFVKKAIEGIRSEKKSIEASPSVSTKSGLYKKFTEKEISRMSSEEIEKLLNELQG